MANSENLQLVPFTEASKILGISKSAAYTLKWRGLFPVPVIAVAGRMKCRLRDLEKFVQTGEVVKS